MRSLGILSIIIVFCVLFIGCGGIPQEVQQQINQLQTELNQLKTDKSALSAQKNQLENQLNELKKQLSSAPDMDLKDPTYDEALAFMRDDKTNEEITRDFALANIVVLNNALKKGYKASYVIAQLNVYYPGGMGWNFVGFNTSDKGWVYFCTSGNCADNLVTLETGKNLYQLNPGFGSNPGIDDTIVAIYYFPKY